MQPRKLQFCIWRVSIKPSLRFSWFCVFFVSKGIFLLLWWYARYITDAPEKLKKNKTKKNLKTRPRVIRKWITKFTSEIIYYILWHEKCTWWHEKCVLWHEKCFLWHALEKLIHVCVPSPFVLGSMSVGLNILIRHSFMDLWFWITALVPWPQLLMICISEASKIHLTTWETYLTTCTSEVRKYTLLYAPVKMEVVGWCKGAVYHRGVQIKYWLTVGQGLLSL